MLFHRHVKPRHINSAALFAQGVLGQVEGETVGVVELEGGSTRQVGPFRQAGQFVVQQAQTTVERGAKAGFFQAQRRFDQALGAGQFGIGAAHLPDQGGHQTEHHRVLCAQHMRMTHGTAHDAAQHIAAPLVRGHDTIGNQERGRTQVVCDHPVVHLAAAIRVGRGGMGRGHDQRAHQICVVVVMLALQEGADPLQPHAGVDALHLQRDQTAIGELLVLHENVVPDLDEAVAVLIGTARRATPDMVAVVIENLGAGAAGTGRAHAPEVVI